MSGEAFASDFAHHASQPVGKIAINMSQIAAIR